jgi:hypothetical protein
MTDSLQRRRRLRAVAKFYGLELHAGLFASTLVQLGGEDNALRVLEAAWREIEAEQIYGECKRPWAWWAFTRPELIRPGDPAGDAIVLNAAGVLSDEEVAAMIEEAERSLDRIGRVVWHGRFQPVVVAEALIAARGMAPLRPYEVRS